MPDQVIVTHATIEIRLAVAEGRFWCTLDGRRVASKSLEEIKRRIDNYARAKARAIASDVRVTVFIGAGGSYYRGWEDADDDSRWITGTFAGVNAHTDEVTIKEANKREQTVSAGSSHFFLASNTAGIAEVKALVKERAIAYHAAKVADAKVDRALDRHAHTFQMPQGRDSTATERAAAAEQALLRALGIVEKDGP